MNVARSLPVSFDNSLGGTCPRPSRRSRAAGAPMSNTITGSPCSSADVSTNDHVSGQMAGKEDHVRRCFSEQSSKVLRTIGAADRDAWGQRLRDGPEGPTRAGRTCLFRSFDEILYNAQALGDVQCPQGDDAQVLGRRKDSACARGDSPHRALAPRR